jgi:hypothetical protein
MDTWYEQLVEHAESFGLDRDLVDRFESLYDRQLEPLQALIATMHDVGLCSEDGDFGAEWQGLGRYDRQALGWEDEE